MIKIPPAKTDFIVGIDDFKDIEVVPHVTEALYGFRHVKRAKLVRYFILAESKEVVHVCEVKLLKNGEKFTPRLHFSTRFQENTAEFAKVQIKRTEDAFAVKASV